MGPFGVIILNPPGDLVNADVKLTRAADVKLAHL